MFKSAVGFLFAMSVSFAGLTVGWVSAAHAADVVFSPDQVEPVKVKRPAGQTGPRATAREIGAFKAHNGADVKPIPTSCYRVAARLLVCEKAGH